MTDTTVIHLAAQAIALAVKVAGPVLVVSLGIGLAVSLFQSVTQIQEFTLGFVPKLAGVAAVIVMSGHWVLGQLEGFTTSLFAEIPHLLAG